MSEVEKLVIPQEALDAAAFVTCTIEGVLEESDLRELSLRGETTAAPAPPAFPEDPADLARIKERHHHVARLIANGLTQRLVATICNYTESYLSVLLNNPAMQELVELYRIQQGASVAVITEKLKTVGMKALEALDEKIDGGSLNNQELLAAAKLGLDRSGHGPASKTHHVDERHIIDHAELSRINARARERSKNHIVPAAEVRAALPAPEPKEQTHETDREVEAPIDLEDRSGIRSESEGRE